jgi:hypothetical protein
MKQKIFSRVTPDLSAQMRQDAINNLSASRTLRQAVLARRALLEVLRKIKERPAASGNVLSYAAGKQKSRRFDGAAITNFWDITP